MIINVYDVYDDYFQKVISYIQIKILLIKKNRKIYSKLFKLNEKKINE
jgi:hypothetical protein